MTKRLTEKQKEEILRSFKSGTEINVLSQKYTCTNSTIIRNLKKILGELKFKELFNKSKSLKGKPKTNENLMPLIIDAALEYATLGEIVDSMKSVFGEWQEKAVI